MKSNYERKRFNFIFWIIAGIFITISAVLLMLLYVDGDSSTRIIVGLVGFTILFMVILIYLLTSKLIGMAYDSVDNISDDMDSFMKNGEIHHEDEEILYEGSVGVLYDNFDKLIDMFRESEKREKSEKEYLKDVMSDISHQLKTPLASMNVFLDLLINDKVETDDEKKEILSETSNQVSRMEWMVLSMLKLARIEAGAIRFEKRKSDLKLIIDEVLGGIRYLIDSRGQKLLVECPDGIEVDVDPEWLTEVIINIVKNASDYSIIKDGTESEAGKIELRVERNSVYTRIYITDHGIGMTEETMTHIFDRFYRASNDVNPNSVGIGLSLSKSIVEGMGGRITVDSEPGQGSTFKIQL